VLLQNLRVLLFLKKCKSDPKNKSLALAPPNTLQHFQQDYRVTNHSRFYISTKLNLKSSKHESDIIIIELMVFIVPPNGNSKPMNKNSECDHYRDYSCTCPPNLPSNGNSTPGSCVNRSPVFLLCTSRVNQQAGPGSLLSPLRVRLPCLSFRKPLRWSLLA
jgi:hypothetical protein